MEIRVLGCHGSQCPGYNMTGFLVNGTILVDAGTVTSALTLEEQGGIDHVLVTHAHLDHVRDMPLLADNIYHLRRTQPLMVYGTQAIVSSLRTYLFNGVIWPDFSAIPTADKPTVRFQVIVPGEPACADGIRFTCITLNHTVETVGYVIESEGQAVIFMGDTGPTQEIWKVANGLANLRAIFIETSLPDSMQDLAAVSGHLTPSGLERELTKLRAWEPDVYLYHLKIPLYDTIKGEIERLEKGNLHILQDGQVILL
jgi:ribonuclease BN (tRNA processing enzyme)